MKIQSSKVFIKLYSGESPLFKEGNVFRIIIPLKKITALKLLAHVAYSVVYNVAHNTFQKIGYKNLKRQTRLTLLKKKSKKTDYRNCEETGMSVKTIERLIKEIKNLEYIGSGNNGIGN